jgi:hypothetical protein
MEDDLHKTFGEIFDEDISAFRKQLLDIQHITADRKKSEEWVQNLRFLDISQVPDLQAERNEQDWQYARAKARDPLIERTAPSRIIPVTECEDDEGEDYIAVSWKWAMGYSEHSLPSDPDRQLPTFHYWIKRPGQVAHESSFPDLYMDRVIRFAQSGNITRLWIDKECIYQKPGDERKWTKDKELGVQIMDVVYGDSANSVGLLTTSLTQQYEVDILSSLLVRSRSIFVDPTDEEKPKLQCDVRVEVVQMLIVHILSDPRWSRGWIFQEDHLASSRMTLLIPCGERLRKDNEYDFGDIPGELQVQLADFRKAVTMFCMACPEYYGRWPNTEILGKAKQYNIWNKKVRDWSPTKHPDLARLPSHIRDGIISGYNYSNAKFLPTTTNSVLDDIRNRSLENEEDRIAILANALRFSKRLDTGKDSPLVKPGDYSLSTALLALILMNGEILMNIGWDPGHNIPTPKTLMQHTLQSYLENCRYHFNGPDVKCQQTFIDRCRFKPPVITERGIETKGFLFRLLPRQHAGMPSHLLRLSDFERGALPKKMRFLRAGSKLDEAAHGALRIIIQKLNNVWPGGKLVSYMQKQLQTDLNPPQKTKPFTSYKLNMMCALYQALRDGQELRLARLASASDDAEPTAIFIKPERDGLKTEAFSRSSANDEEEALSVRIFTSLDGGWDGREWVVSLEVAIFDEGEGERQYCDDGNGKCSMLNYGWVNGVWCGEREKMDTYVFPLAGITQSPNLHEDGIGKKRKRKGDDEDESVENLHPRRGRLRHTEEI